MHKELIVTFLVITIVVIGHVITQNNTKNAVNSITTQLLVIRENITDKENRNKNFLNKKLEELENSWKNEHEKMAYYIEHNEIEKAETEITKLKADIEVEEYNIAIENLDNCMFILEHIQDKSALKIVNIF